MDWGLETNIRGPQGIQGPPGSGMKFKGTVPTAADLPVGAADGDAYQTEDTDTLYVWDAGSGAWIAGTSLTGPPGPQGNPGADSTVPGPAGPGVAAGGTAGQVLSKIDGTSYNTQWTTIIGGATVNTTAPASPVTGQLWWHTTEKTLRIWDGTAWQPVLATWA
jgi:hypothetical protein